MPLSTGCLKPAASVGPRARTYDNGQERSKSTLWYQGARPHRGPEGRPVVESVTALVLAATRSGWFYHACPEPGGLRMSSNQELAGLRQEVADVTKEIST